MRTIGVFDSGVGGVSVLKEILKYFPHDNIIYFGDSLHAPYGERSIDEIRKLCLKVSDFLVFNKKVDAVVVACNTATGAAIDIMKERYSIPVIGVVSNGAKAALKVSNNLKIGILATPATVHMAVYPKVLNSLNKNTQTYQVKCPLFVELIENGWMDSDINDNLIKNYLSFLPKDVDTLILGCTHYPLIEKYIARFYKGNIVDPAIETVEFLIKEIGLSNSKKLGTLNFFVSGDCCKFKIVAEDFLGKKISNIENIVL